MQQGDTLHGIKMADNKTKRCSSCGENTKYTCLDCGKPVCNRSLECSSPADASKQIEFVSVSYCRDCDLKLNVGESSGISRGEESEERSVSSSEFTETNHFDTDWEWEHNRDDNETDVMDKIMTTAINKGKKRKRGKKCEWKDEDLDDFVDIIINDENHQRKLIFQNTKTKTNKSNYESIQKELKKRAEERKSVFEKSVTQMRNKFKKLVSECKQANMIFKTATGISNYKDKKNYSQWFDMLFPLIKSRESCQPEQALEPSSGHAYPTTSDKESGASLLEDPDESDSTKNSDEKLFVPKIPTRKNKKGDNKLIEKTTEVLQSVQSLLQSQQTSSFLEFMEKENARARAHELEMLKLLIPSAQQQAQQTFEHSNPNAMASSSDRPMASSHIPQGWPSSYVPISTSSQVALPFGNHGSQQPYILTQLNSIPVGAANISNYPHGLNPSDSLNNPTGLF